jgi:FlaA1/EpsC-like NDP-sugar epimerase
MYRQQFYIVANFLMVWDTLIIITTGYVAYAISLDMTAGGLVMGWYDFLGAVLFLMFANNYFMGRMGFYSAKRFPSTFSMLRALSIAVAMGFIVLSTGIILVGIKPFSREYLAIHFGIALVTLGITRVILYYYLDKRAMTTFNSRQILLVGDTERVCALADALDQQRSWGHQVVGCLHEPIQGNPAICNVPVLGAMDSFDNVVQEHEIDEIIFALPKGSRFDLNTYLEKCKKIGVAVRIVPALFDPKLSLPCLIPMNQASGWRTFRAFQH